MTPETRHRQRAVDTTDGRIGEVMPPAFPGSRLIHLRPVGGGREWTVNAEDVQLLDDEQQQEDR